MRFLKPAEQEVDSQIGAGKRIATIMLCFLINLMDGFDVLAMAFSAPAVAQDWSIGAMAIGWLLSAALFGMAAGAFFISPLADRLGRRPIIIFSLCIIAIAMTGAAASRSIIELGLTRFVTGLAIGGVMTSTSALVLEYCRERWRGMGMALMAVAFPLGAVAGGGGAYFLLEAQGWRALFLTGGIAAFLLVALSLPWLPESHAWLSRKAEMTAAMAQRAVPSLFNGFKELLAGDQAAHSWRMGAIFFLFMLSFYFFQSWLPPLAVAAGASQPTAAATGVWLNLGGIFGALCAGLLIHKWGARAVGSCAVALTAAGIGLAGHVLEGGGGPHYGSAALTGSAMFASMAALYTVMLPGFSVEARVTGVGLVSTAGRIGSLTGPATAGYLLANGLGSQTVCLLMAAPALASLPLLALSRSGRPFSVRGSAGTMDQRV